MKAYGHLLPVSTAGFLEQKTNLHSGPTITFNNMII